MKFDFQNLCHIILYGKIVFFSVIFVQYKCGGSNLCVRFHEKIMPDSVSTKWHMIIGTSNFFKTEILVHSYNPTYKLSKIFGNKGLDRVQICFLPSKSKIHFRFCKENKAYKTVWFTHHHRNYTKTTFRALPCHTHINVCHVSLYH